MENTPSNNSITSGPGPGYGSGSGSGSNSEKRVRFKDEVDHDVAFDRMSRIQDIDGFEKIILRSPRGPSAKVRLYGGQVVSWINHRGDELLFTSSNSLKPPNSLRGGIQVCFPQFGKCDRFEQHGFARNKMWEVDDNPPLLPFQFSTGYDTFVDLLLKPTEEEIKTCPLSYELRLRVALADNGNLTLIPRVTNMATDPNPLVFTFVLHSHFLVSDISNVVVEGLETLSYLDNLQDRKLCSGQKEPLIFESEIDRIYKESNNVVTMQDRKTGRSIRIKTNRLLDVPVWNPWKEKERRMPEFGNGDYKRMVCVGAAVVEPPISIQAGAQWKGRMVLEYFGDSILRRASSSSP